MESKVTTREKIISCFKDGQTIAIGGQTGARHPAGMGMGGARNGGQHGLFSRQPRWPHHTAHTWAA